MADYTIIPGNEYPTNIVELTKKLRDITNRDIEVLCQKEKDYQGSWKKRGGVGAFMMLARKWDRIEAHLESEGVNWDIFEAIRKDKRTEGVLDDVRDLRRYLLLIETEL